MPYLQSVDIEVVKHRLALKLGILDFVKCFATKASWVVTAHAQKVCEDKICCCAPSSILTLMTLSKGEMEVMAF